MKTREDFHRLIDKIKDEEILRGFYDLIQQLNKQQTGELWSQLNTEERAELLLAYEESFDSKNLVSHEQLKSQHNKWLKK